MEAVERAKEKEKVNAKEEMIDSMHAWSRLQIR
jgi:hypothetical protein